MFIIPSKGFSIFAATGDDLKITSVNRPLFHAKKGTCELKEIRSKNYEWVVTEKIGSTRKRSFKFKVTKFLDIQCHFRDSGQFQIIVKESGDTTQLLGRLDMSECQTLVTKINSIKMQITALTTQTTKGDWLCAKENLPQLTNSYMKENDCLKSPRMTKVLERGMGGMDDSSNINKTHLQDQSVLKGNNGPLTETIYPTLRPLQRTPLGDKPFLSHLMNKSQTQLFPSADELKMAESDAKENSDGELPTITAIGMSKGPSSFYSSAHKDKPATRHTYGKKKPTIPIIDKNKWRCFRERNDLLRSQKESGSDSVAIPVGFSNLGNTCYMNSILQCLLNIPTFFQDLNNYDNLQTVQHNSLYNSLCNLGLLKYSHESLENQKYALKRVKSAISLAADRFSGYAQHDAHELLCQCLDQLKEDLHNETKKKYEVLGSEIKLKELKENGCTSCPIKLNFESTILHSITCESCGEKVLKEEACHDFSLVIPDSDENTSPDMKTIEGLLSMYFDREMIEYTCEKCKGAYSVLSHHFCKLPRVLVIHLKRYGVNESKKSDSISIPKTINLTNHVDKGTTKAAPTFHYDRNRLNVKFEMSVEDKITKSLCSAEKRKSPESLDLEPLLKQPRSSTEVLEKTSGEKEGINTWQSDVKKTMLTNGPMEIVDSDDEKLQHPLRESKKDFDQYTQIQSTSDIADDGRNFPDIDIANDGDGIFDGMSLTEEQQIQRALDLSMRDLEKSQIDIFQELDCKNPGQSSKRDNTCSSSTRDEEMEDSVHENMYNLVGIVNHHGENTETGHYTSDSYDFKSNKWRSYNDSSVKEVREHEVRYSRLNSAYIVFYMHKQCYAAIADV